MADLNHSNQRKSDSPVSQDYREGRQPVPADAFSSIGIENTEYQLQPAQFVAILREQFLSTGYRLVGSIPKDPRRDERIDIFMGTNPLISEAAKEAKNPNDFRAAAERLLKCFERLCHRTKATIPDNAFRLQIYHHLVEQLVQNTEFFGFNPRSLVTATLMSPRRLTELPGADFVKESPELRKLFYRAFTANPQSIERFFDVGHERLSELQRLLNDSNRTMARAFQVLYAFFKIQCPIQDLVAQHFALVDELCNHEDFSAISRSTIEGVIGRQKPALVRAELERIVRESKRLLEDPEIQIFFGSRMYHVQYAVMGHSRYATARASLMTAAHRESRICELYRALNEKCDLKYVRDLCVKVPARAEALEEELLQKLVDSQASSERTL